MRKNILFTVIIVGVLLVVAQMLFIVFRTPIPALKSGDMVALSRLIVRGEDHVRAEDLADWIVAGREDFLLVDVRPDEEFQAGHIETARHIALPELLQNGTLEQLPSDRSIVLYSNGTANAAQAVVVLRCAGKKAYSLMGGYNHWQDFMRNPELAGEADEEILQIIKRKATAWSFSDDYDAVGGMPIRQVFATPASSPIQAAEPVEDEEDGEEEEDEGELIVEEGC